MSTEQVTVQNQNPTQTILPQVSRVTVGEETYNIAPFCLAKTMLTFRLLSELAQSAGVGDALGSFGGDGLQSVAGSGVLPGLIRRALDVLPTALQTSEPALYRVLGLIITANSRLRDLEEREEDIDAYLLSEGRRLAYAGTVEALIGLVLAAINQIGIETILGNLPSLLRVVNGLR